MVEFISSKQKWDIPCTSFDLRHKILGPNKSLFFFLKGHNCAHTLGMVASHKCFMIHSVKVQGNVLCDCTMVGKTRSIRK